MKLRSDISIIVITIVLIVVLFWLNLTSGDVKIDWRSVINLLSGGNSDNLAWSYIVESRLNRSIVALFAGGALGVSGLILQVFFRNPLAGPGVLGITSGASLGVAIVILGGVTMNSILGNVSVIIAGILGAFVVLFLLLILSRFIRNSITLLVTGLMFSYFTSALINILYHWANETDTRAYVLWGFGSFEGLERVELNLFVTIITCVVLMAFLLIKPLNGMVAGPEYASSLGINIKRSRVLIILITGVLAAIVTVYCGPIGFVGIAVPQLIRTVIRSTNHAVILPAVFLGGSFLALFADYVVRLTSNNLPLNTVTALIGAPIIIAVIVKMNRRNAEI